MGRRVGILLLFMILGLSLPVDRAAADLYWENDQVVQSATGEVLRRTKVRYYLNHSCARMDIGGNVVIADFDAMTGYVLDDEDKIYLEMKMKTVGRIPEGLKAEIRVTPTDETRKIAGYTCRKYKVVQMEREYEEWLSKEVDGYSELREIDRRLGPVMRENPLFQMGIVGRMDRLDGFPVRRIMPLENGSTKVVTLKRVLKKTLDPSVFKVPEDYKPPYN